MRHTSVRRVVFAVAMGFLSLHTAPTDARHAAVEGFGAGTRGGEGKPQCVVDSLADDGAGTLRACLHDGNRRVTFAVAGTIRLASQLALRGPFVTIDGFSAPSPGITLVGGGIHIFDQHDVVIRGLRIRNVGIVGAEDVPSARLDCVSVYGDSWNIVLDHLSIHNCGDGGIDISSGPKDITIQWSLVSTSIFMLWGSTSDSPRRDTDRISMHHTMLICNSPLGCDRAPLIRASGAVVRVDLRHNVFEGWIRSNATKVEPAAAVNVVGNAYIPRPASTPSQRAASLAVGAGTRVFTADNVELGAPPRPDLNHNGNQPGPLPAPPITEQDLGCVVRDAGVHPRDAVDLQLVARVASVPGACETAPPSGS